MSTSPSTNKAPSHRRASKTDWRRLDTPTADGVELLEHNEHHHESTEQTTTHIKPSSPSRSTSLLWAWFPEILASIASLLSFLATVIVLWVYQGRAASATSIYRGLTLNSLLALLATINRSCLMVPLCSGIMQELWLYLAAQGQHSNPTSCLGDFERFAQASQGTYGSLIFLYQTRGRRIVACFGCLITIASLLYSTFIQQLVKLHNLPNPNADLPGNVIRSEFYHGSEGNLAEGEPLNPPLAMIASINDGVLREGLQPPVSLCPSGNCTWPLTPSLAVCGGCSNSSYKLVQCYSLQGAQGYCNYTLASGSVVSLGLVGNTTFWNGRPEFQVVPSDTPQYNERNVIYLSKFELFGYPYQSYVKSSDVPLAATECALWMCIQVYNTTTTLSVQSQNITDTFIKTNYTIGYGAITQDFLQSQFAFDPLPTTVDPKGATKYYSDGPSILALQQYLNISLNGHVSLSTATQHATSDFVRGAWNGTTGPQAWIANIALSMTGMMRSSHVQSRSEFGGIMYELAVVVRWPWITLPAALVIMSIVFLALVMVRTARSQVLSWKGSPLVLLLMDLDVGIKEELYAVSDKQQNLNAVVGEEKVRMVKQPGRFWEIKTD